MNGLSLFANVGIAETYLDELGFKVKVANELLPARAEFYRHSHPDCNMICGDITNSEIFESVIAQAKKNNVKFILATPPCQGMSMAGKMDEADPRNTLIVKVMEAVKALSPEFVLIENVPQMLKTSILYQGQAVKITDFIAQMCQGQYEIVSEVFDTSNHGTPQYRKRAIIRLFKKQYQWKNPITQNVITVRDTIGHLPSIEAGEDSGIEYHKAKTHNARHILWMKNTPTGKTAFDNPVFYPKKETGERIRGFKTTYKRIEWDRPSPTITMANGSVSSQNNVHPGRQLPDGTYSDARVLTLLELFKLTGLPDCWKPPKNASEHLIRDVIGEAVPPNLLKALFSEIKHYL
jgi:DNA (cytosine-5)-methyltransferase 1